MAKNLTISQLSQWQYTDKMGNVNITPRIGTLALLIKQLYPYNFFNKKEIDKNQADNIANIMESMGYEKRKNTLVYANCFITGDYWSKEWRNRLKKQSEQLKKKLSK